MAKALWGGRFRHGLDDAAKQFSYSLAIDSRLVFYDIRVNKAHAGALKHAGIFSDDDYQRVSACLDDLAESFKKDPAALLGDDEDIHSCIERLVTAELGDLGKRLHTGKSRNDQVITDVRLFVKDNVDILCELLESVIKDVWGVATDYIDTPFPGFTHLQTAQPVLLSHHMLAYVEKFSRDLDRFRSVGVSADVCPLGSAALAGNNYGLDRRYIADQLGFSELTHNSMDAVSDRDFILEFLSAASICMTHLSRFCDELILWSSPLLGFVDIGDAFTTGSSIMPQKKNPDIAELIRGKSGRVLGNLTGMFHLIKGLPLTYNRDLQEDKERLFDSADTVRDSLTCFGRMIRTLEFKREAIDRSLREGYALATELADYLVKKGIPFRDAHDITGAVVLFAVDSGKGLDELSMDDFISIDERFDNDVFSALTVSAALDAKSVYGGTSLAQVTTQLERIKEKFGW